VVKEVEGMLQQLQLACADGLEKLKGTKATNPYVVHTVVLASLRALHQNAQAALAAALAEHETAAPVLTVAPEAWGGNSLRPSQPACFGGARKARRGWRPKGTAPAGTSGTSLADGAAADGASAEAEAAPLMKVFKEPKKRKTAEGKSLEGVSGPHIKRARQKGAPSGAKVACATTYIFPPELTDAQLRCVHDVLEAYGKHHVSFTSAADGQRRIYFGGDGSGREDVGTVNRLQHPKGKEVSKAQLQSWLDGMRPKAPHVAPAGQAA
jgi:hypothetical protein